MQIGCTQKLIDFLGCEIKNIDRTLPTIFNFTANLITVNRRKCVVITHNESRCGFVLYGISAKDKKSIFKLILQGIETMLRKERYSDEIINQFLFDCGEPVFTKTDGRTMISRINRFCERIMINSNRFEEGSMFQDNILPKLNDDIVKLGNDYDFCYKKLAELIESFYNKAPYCYKALILDVDLQLASGVCNRRVIVPSDLSLFQLHLVIQNIFEWENYHMHRFILKTARNGEILEYASVHPEEDSIFDSPQTIIHNEFSILLSDIFPNKKKIIYEYDFGDDWIHTVRYVKAIDNCSLPAPMCEKADDLAPPEDCGGPYGFERLQEILSDPKDEQYEDMLMWYGFNKIYNNAIAFINHKLTDVIRYFPTDTVEEFDCDDAYEYDYE